MIQYGEQDINSIHTQKEDILLNSYLHPALIGKLPIPWFNGQFFDNLREDQARLQQLTLCRLVSQQRLSIEEDVHVDIMNPRDASNFRSFFEGLLSWVYMFIS